MYHLDNLRRGRKITVESFCSGICSDRQYRRLLSGEQNVSDQKLYEFCNKLGISTKDFYYSANEKDKYEYSKIAKLYQYLNKSNYKDFEVELKKIKKDRLVSVQNERFLEFCIIKYHYVMGKITNKQTVEKLALICSYPNSINYKNFDFVDIISLEIIAEIEVKHNQEKALKLLYKILTSPNLIYISSESRHILPNIYGTVSILLSRLSKYEEAFKLATSGISYSINQSNSSTMTHLYYVKAYTSLKMNKVKQAEIFALKSLSNAISRNDKAEYELTFNLIKRNLKVNPISLFSLYKDDLFD